MFVTFNLIIVSLIILILGNSPKLKIGQARWLTLVIPTLWEAKVGGSLEVRSLDQPGQHSETPSLLKIQKLAGHRGWRL